MSYRDAKSASKSIETDRSLGSATAEATEENSSETKEDGEWGTARSGLTAEGASTSRDEVEMLKSKVDERGRLQSRKWMCRDGSGPEMLKEETETSS